MKSKRIRLLIASAFVVWLAGCASPASKEALVVDDTSSRTKHPYSVSISTSGGGKTSALGYPNVSNEDLSAAIEESIMATGLFSSVINGNDADYKLNVSLVGMSKPTFGFSFTIHMVMAWSLVNMRTGDTVMKESIKSTYTATAGKAFLAVSRIRIAVEGATQNNIRQGLNKIAALSLTTDNYASGLTGKSSTANVTDRHPVVLDQDVSHPHYRLREATCRESDFPVGMRFREDQMKYLPPASYHVDNIVGFSGRTFKGVSLRYLASCFLSVYESTDSAISVIDTYTEQFKSMENYSRIVKAGDDALYTHITTRLQETPDHVYEIVIRRSNAVMVTRIITNIAQSHDEILGFLLKVDSRLSELVSFNGSELAVLHRESADTGKATPKVRTPEYILNNIDGTWGPDDCFCGVCDFWIWVEDRVMYMDTSKTWDRTLGAIITEVNNIHSHSRYYGNETYQLLSFVIINDNESGESFRLTALYDHDMDDVTALYFESLNKHSRYIFQKCGPLPAETKMH